MNHWSDDDPALPYGGTSGWSGSDTSRDRARDADTRGVTGQRQRQALRLLAEAGPVGQTWKELADTLGLHHGGASGVLSVLHKAGRVSRLTATRNRCKVYVLTQYVNDRATEAPGRTAAAGLLEQAIGVLRDRGFCQTHRLTYPDEHCLDCRGAEVVADYDRRRQ